MILKATEMSAQIYLSALAIRLFLFNYRLAPEHRFPQGLEDCYEAMQAVLAHCEDWYQAKQEDIVIMGDSAGGEICAELV